MVNFDTVYLYLPMWLCFNTNAYIDYAVFRIGISVSHYDVVRRCYSLEVIVFYEFMKNCFSVVNFCPVSFMPYYDRIIQMKNGSVIEFFTFWNDLIYRDKDIYIDCIIRQMIFSENIILSFCVRSSTFMLSEM